MHEVPPAHTLPQVPQLLGSELRSRQAPAQLVSPALQEAEQVPWLQTWLLAHAVPHAPQWAGSEARLAHTPAHTVSPAGHTHLDCRHDISGPQTCPHTPQLASSELRFTHLSPHITRPMAQLTSADTSVPPSAASVFTPASPSFGAPSPASSPASSPVPGSPVSAVASELQPASATTVVHNATIPVKSRTSISPPPRMSSSEGSRPRPWGHRSRAVSRAEHRGS